MKATIHLEGQNAVELANGLRAHLAIYEAAGTQSTAPTTTTKGTKTKKAAAPAVVEDEEETDAIDVSTLGQSDEEEESFGMDDDAEEAAPAVTKADMLRVLKAHPSKEKVTKLLQTKFKVKNINELKDTQYGDVIAAVQKLK